jgi:hypothetical protein
MFIRALVVLDTLISTLESPVLSNLTMLHISRKLPQEHRDLLSMSPQECLNQLHNKSSKA